MARQPRKNAISGRVNDAAFEEIRQYTVAAEIDIAELIRLAVSEYIASHPVKKPQEV